MYVSQCNFKVTNTQRAVLPGSGYAFDNHLKAVARMKEGSGLGQR